MNRPTLLTLTAVALIGVAGPVRGDLVAYWSFDDGFTADVGGSAYDLTAVNGATAGDAGGTAGNAASFQRVNSEYAYTGGDVLTANADFTYSAWYNFAVSNITNTNRYFILETTQNDTPSGDAAWTASLGLRDLATATAPDDVQVFTHPGDVVGSTTLTANTWQHVIVTYDADGGTSSDGIMRAYLDGRTTPFATLDNITTTAVGGLVIGGHRAGTGRNFDGQIDEVAFWNTSLSAAESLDVYRRGLHGFGLNDPLIFTYDADGPADPEVTLSGWNETATFTPVGGAGNDLGDAGFAGEYYRTTTSGDDTITIALTDLPSHTAINLGMIVAQLDSLDPSRDGDRFIVKVDGVEVLSVGIGYGTSVSGSFSDEIVYDVKIFGVAAADSVVLDTQTLGGVDLFSNTDFLEHVYDLGLLDAFQSITHTSDTLTLEIIGRQNQTGGEFYGVDNITIQLIPVPAALPAGLGMIALMAARRRR